MSPLPRSYLSSSIRYFGVFRSRVCFCSSASRAPAVPVRKFIEQHTEICADHLTPEIRLRLLTPRCHFWHGRPETWPYADPYWAIYWPGGQALSRYLLDNPHVVAEGSVLDLGSGCGATAIAARMSGASLVLANDIDPGSGRSFAEGTTVILEFASAKWYCRYLLDNPHVVAEGSVLDLGSGCGATAIAARMSGASLVLANDIDPVAGSAIALNCELNSMKPLPVLTTYITDTEPDKWNLIVLGDMFYDEELADSLQQWLRVCVYRYGTKVLIGDPGRPHFVNHRIQRELRQIAEYPLTESTKQENYGLMSSSVWIYEP